MARKYAALAAAAIAVAAAVLAWVAATRPSTVRVERSARVQAPRAMVSARLADVRRWGAWPLPVRADDLRVRFGGPAAGPGSTVYWSGGRETGRFTVLAATDTAVELEVELQRPRTMSADLEFQLSTEGDATVVTASATFERDFFAKAMAVLGWPGKPAASELEAAIASAAAAAQGDGRIVQHRVERAGVVDARPAAVRAALVDLGRWVSWSPWVGEGPDIRRNTGGAPSGAGSSLYWSGPGDAGEGRVTILAATPDGLEVELERSRGAVPSKDIDVAIAADGPRTRVALVATFERDAGDRAGGTGAEAEAAVALELERALAGLAAAAKEPGFAARAATPTERPVPARAGVTSSAPGRVAAANGRTR